MTGIRLFASGSLAVGGMILMGMDIYFGFLRQALLPEDARSIGESLAQIQNDVPGLGRWLTRVFGVLGGLLFATGLLTLYVAATSFRAGRPGVVVIAAISGLASIGWMVITNFLIDSDFQVAASCFHSTLGGRAGCSLGQASGAHAVSTLISERCAGCSVPTP